MHPDSVYKLEFKDVNCLRPNGWLWAHILDAYILLLRDREAKMRSEGIQRWALFYFMPTYFAGLGTQHLLSARVSNATTLKFLRSYINPSVGAPIHECHYIFVPFINESNIHFCLFIWSVNKWKVILFDPLCDDKPLMPLSQLYQNFFTVVMELVPLLLRLANPKAKWPKSKPKVEVCVNRPRRWNSEDCGVYVAKFVDFFLHRINIMKEPRWTPNEAYKFRFRIAHELRMCKARDIPKKISL